MEGLRGLTWNSEGFRDPGKHLFVKEVILEHRLDFIALLETGRSNFTIPFLSNLVAGQNFAWFCLPPHGRSGGILVGINTQTLSVIKVDNGDFCVKLHIKSKIDGFEWIFVPVYGAVQDFQKAEFLSELVRLCEVETLPILLAGDFNILRRREDKSNNNFNPHWPFVFNAITESLNLKEIALSGRQFTWASRREIPTYEKLDRVLASVEWEQKFPLVTVRALTRAGSDHTPLLIDSGHHAHRGNKPKFSFELAWLHQDGFYEMVANEWAAVAQGASPIQTWQKKIRHLRRYLRGWAKNLSGKYKTEKQRLLSIIDTLDIQAESNPLSALEREQLKRAHKCLNRLRRDEEQKWAQRAKVKNIQEGGNNTKYFHLIANGKHRKKRIFQLEQEEGTIVGDENLKTYITEYYKQLLGAPEHNSFSLMEERVMDIPQLSQDENTLLIAPFTEEEVFEAISQMERNKSPGPDGFPVEFYQHF
jgi:mannosylglycoprotein endo-beta-mannosidase